MALKDAHQQVAWTRWPREIAQRHPEALKRWSERLAPQIEAIKFWQFIFFRQWQALRRYAHERDVRIIGDIPIYVAHDSADVWANPQFFLLDAEGNPQKVSGVPPDYFSATGQLWGNPIYNWPLLKETGYRWWIDRFRVGFGVIRHRANRSLPRLRSLLGSARRRNNCGQWTLGKRPGSRTVSRAAGGVRRVADYRGKSRRHHT